MFRKEREQKLKQENKELNHLYDVILEDYQNLEKRNMKLLRNNNIQAKALQEIKEQLEVNPYGSITNLKNKIRKILAECESNLVSNKK